MNKKLIAFTIENATSNDYLKIKNKIKSVTRYWAKLDETLFLVKTERSSVNLREIIRGVILEGKLKKVFVCNWENPAAWVGMSDSVTKWLHNA